MTKSCFASTVLRIVVGAALAAAPAIGCADSPNDTANSGAGGQVQCVIVGPQTDASAIPSGIGGTGGARTDGGVILCSGTGGVGNTAANGTGGTGTY